MYLYIVSSITIDYYTRSAYARLSLLHYNISVIIYALLNSVAKRAGCYAVGSVYCITYNSATYTTAPSPIDPGSPVCAYLLMYKLTLRLVSI